MARDPETKKISAFVVETDSPGVRVEHRCRFMGLRAISNVVLSFENVRVPALRVQQALGGGAPRGGEGSGRQEEGAGASATLRRPFSAPVFSS